MKFFIAMLRTCSIATRSLLKSTRVQSSLKTPSYNSARFFSDKLPNDSEFQTGRRKEEIDAEAVGEIAFNEDPIIPSDDAGTMEKPILVGPSCMKSVLSREGNLPINDALFRNNVIPEKGS